MTKFITNVEETAGNKPNTSTAFDVGNSVTNADGTRTIAAAYSTTETLPYMATDNAGLWESGIGTFTIGTPNTLVRTTILESSNTDAAVDFSGGGDVTIFVEWPASIAEQSNRVADEADAGAHLTNQSDTITTTSLTGVVGKLHLCTIAGLTANRDFILPSVCAAGDRIGVYIIDGDASFELLLKPATGDTINNGLSGAEWSRLFIANEIVIFKCITANSEWIVERDGRIPSKGLLRLTTSATTNTAGTSNYATDNGGAWTAEVDVGNITDVSTDKIKVRRNCYVDIHASCRALASVTPNNYFGAQIIHAPSALIKNGFDYATVVTGMHVETEIDNYVAVPGDEFRHAYKPLEANIGVREGSPTYDTIFSLTEVLL